MDRREVIIGGLDHGSSRSHTRTAEPRRHGPLLTRKIPSSGEAIPVIGLGTSGPFEVGSSQSERAPLKEVLDAFFAAGARLIDTSPMYSTAEGVLGDLMTPAMHQTRVPRHEGVDARRA